MKTVKITSIEMTLKNGQTVTLTLDEAKELHEQLDQMFGAKPAPIVITRPRREDRNPWDRTYPRPRPFWWESPLICYSGNSGLRLEARA